MENNSINIQKIVEKEIRVRAREIARESPVFFERTMVFRAADELRGEDSYDLDALAEQKWRMKQHAHILFYRPIEGGPLRRFIRKVIRKCIFFLIEPMSVEIGQFNGAAAQAVAQLSTFVFVQDELNRRQRRQIEALEARIAALEEAQKAR